MSPIQSSKLNIDVLGKIGSEKLCEEIGKMGILDTDRDKSSNEGTRRNQKDTLGTVAEEKDEGPSVPHSQLTPNPWDHSKVSSFPSRLKEIEISRPSKAVSVYETRSVHNQHSRSPREKSVSKKRSRNATVSPEQRRRADHVQRLREYCGTPRDSGPAERPAEGLNGFGRLTSQARDAQTTLLATGKALEYAEAANELSPGVMAVLCGNKFDAYTNANGEIQL